MGDENRPNSRSPASWWENFCPFRLRPGSLVIWPINRELIDSHFTEYSWSGVMRVLYLFGFVLPVLILSRLRFSLYHFLVSRNGTPIVYCVWGHCTLVYCYRPIVPLSFVLSYRCSRHSINKGESWFNKKREKKKRRCFLSEVRNRHKGFLTH